MPNYTIDETTARRAHEANHMSDYKTNSATAEYTAAVEAAAELVAHKKEAVSPYYHEKLDALLDQYARRLAAWTNAYNRNSASYPSQFISGAGNYDMKKFNKKISREESLWKEYHEITEILDKIRAVGTGAVDLADPHAREILTAQLEKLQKTLATGKAMNAHYRRHKTMQGFESLTAERAQKLDEALATAPPFAQKPFPDYELTSLRGKIKRVQERLNELDRRQSKKDQDSKTTKFSGGEIVRNTEIDRLQLIFTEKPGEKLREALKQNGFRYSPKNTAWQRQLTENAECAARRVLDLTKTAAP